MRVLIVHNRYLYPGGEDVVADAEERLLRAHGHAVERLEDTNERIPRMGALQLAAQTVWSQPSYRRIRQAIRTFRPDLMHVHNLFPLFSPSVLFAARAEGIPSVMTLHNFRLICLGGQLLRAGRVCESCLKHRSHLPGVAHACYRDSRAASAVTGAMLLAHRFCGTWQRGISRYIALTNSSRDAFVRGGLPPERISVKPNFMDQDPVTGSADRKYALFVGRLSREKGLDVLMAAWKAIAPACDLVIAGDGPDRSKVETFAEGTPGVTYVGQVPPDRIPRLFHEALFLIFPSIWYETFGLVLLEAFATATPVIASRLGAAAEMVGERERGCLFEPGSANDLAETIRWALEHRAEMREMGSAGRRAYESKYTAERNYTQLLSIYEDALCRPR